MGHWEEYVRHGSLGGVHQTWVIGKDTLGMGW
jgi:hypothetical protein